MNEVANLSVIENLQAQANESMGHQQPMSQMSVFNDTAGLQKAYQQYISIVKKGAEAEKKGEHGWLDSKEGQQYWKLQSAAESAFAAEKRRLYDEFYKIYQKEADTVEKEYLTQKKEILKSKAFDTVRKEFAKYNELAKQEESRSFGIHGEMKIVDGLIPEPNETWAKLR